MRKRFNVYDSHVLLRDLKSPLHFADENIVIPIQVFEEVDRFKNGECYE